MNNLLDTINGAIVNMPWLAPAAGALIILLVIVLIAVNRRHKSEIEDWSDQCRNLRNEIDSLDKDQRMKKTQIAAGEEELGKAREELTLAKEDFAGRLKAREEETAAQLQAKEEETTARLKAREEETADQLKAKDEAYGAQIQEKDDLYTAQLREQEEKYEQLIRQKDEAAAAEIEKKNAEVAQMQEQVEQWNLNRDAIVSDARKQADQIIADANQSAVEIMEEAARRLAESEEEVRKNRLIAAGSLTDARKRISEMLLSAAGELCKGIPASSPIGYAPVYKIEETEAAQILHADAEVEESETDEVSEE